MTPNKFNKLCKTCGHNVAPYKGVCERVNGMGNIARWEVRHTDCAHPNSPSPLATTTEILERNQNVPVASALADINFDIPEWTEADWERVSGVKFEKPKPILQPTYAVRSTFLFDDADDECYLATGMSNHDYRDAMCPDEGDKG